MHRFYRLWALTFLVALMVGNVRAETYKLNDGTILTGEPVSFDERGAVFRLTDGTYSERTLWAKFSQEDLKQLATNAKAQPFVEPFIEVSDEEKAKKNEITIKPVVRMERPSGGSILGGLLKSSVGLTVLLILYAANFYAAYEIASVRAYPPGMVCGIAAVAPVITQIIFLSLPTRLKTRKQEQQEILAKRRAEEAVAAAARSEEKAEQAAVAEQAVVDAGPVLPPTQVFQRGEFVFNRRFFETKFASYFGVVRREADRDMVLTIKSARGEFVVQRFTRIAPNDMHIQVQRGHASEEVIIPFTEVKEVILKHQDA
jgi:hypothetical protein